MLLYLLLWFKKECDIWICESDSNGKPFAHGATKHIFNTPLQMSIPYWNFPFVFNNFIKNDDVVTTDQSAPLEVDLLSLTCHCCGRVVTLDDLNVLLLI